MDHHTFVTKIRSSIREKNAIPPSDSGKNCASGKRGKTLFSLPSSLRKTRDSRPFILSKLFGSFFYLAFPRKIDNETVPEKGIIPADMPSSLDFLGFKETIFAADIINRTTYPFAYISAFLVYVQDFTGYIHHSNKKIKYLIKHKKQIFLLGYKKSKPQAQTAPNNRISEGLLKNILKNMLLSTAEKTLSLNNTSHKKTSPLPYKEKAAKTDSSIMGSPKENILLAYPIHTHKNLSKSETPLIQKDNENLTSFIAPPKIDAPHQKKQIPIKPIKTTPHSALTASIPANKETAPSQEKAPYIQKILNTLKAPIKIDHIILTILLAILLGLLHIKVYLGI